jgi:hypothetical protein
MRMRPAASLSSPPPSSSALPRAALALFLAALTALPLSGCLADPKHGGLPVAHASGLFPFEAHAVGAARIEPVGTCADLRDVLRERALREARVALDQSVEQQGWGGWGWGRGDLMAVEADSAPAAGAGAAHFHSVAGAQVTGTNNQETAADEADLVKTDGEWTYVLASGILHILRSRTVGGLEEFATLTFDNRTAGWGGELLLERRDLSNTKDDRLVVVLPGQSTQGQQFLTPATQQRTSGGMTRILVLSLADRKAPAIEQETWIEGQPSAARLVDGTVYVIVQRSEQFFGLRTWVGPQQEDLARLGMSEEDYQAMDAASQKLVRQHVALLVDADNQALLDTLPLEETVPMVLRSAFGFVLPEPVSDEACQQVMSMPDATGRAFTTILAIAVTDPALPTSTKQVLGGSAIVYADAGTLVLAAPTQDAWWSWAQPRLEEATDLLWFDLNGLDVVQRAAGRVPGTVLDSFALDVHAGSLRVATTMGSWNRGWLAEGLALVSQVTVLDEKTGILVPRGSVGGIAPGEYLWSVRFTDDRAYVVTFRQTDPLWVVDLVGTVPRLLGELKVAGVSTYIHPLGDDLLLTIGYGAGEGDLGLDESRIVVSLFDVRDAKHPQRADFVDLAPSDGWSWSGALREHRAFTYWDAVGTLAVPLTTSRSYEARSGPDSQWVTEQHVGLSLVSVDTSHRKLAIRGSVNQDDLVPSGNAWWGGGGIERSWFLGFPGTGPVSVYAMSPYGVASNDLDTLARQAQVGFPVPQGYGGCCSFD